MTNPLLPPSDASLSGSRILLLFPHLTAPGGALSYTLELAAFLAQRGATVGILALRVDALRFPPPAGVEYLSLNGPLTSSLAYWGLLPLWQVRINARIADWQPDLLMPQVFPANWWGWLYKRSCPGVRLVWICHEPSAFLHSRAWIAALTPCWKRWLAQALRPLLARVDVHLSRHADRILANSSYTAGTVREIYGRQTSAVLYPGIDRQLFHPAPPESGRLREGIVTVARLTKFKRIDFLLRVFAGLLPQHPELVFNIVGRGEDEKPLRALARHLGIAPRVTFHGSLDVQALASLYRSSLLFLHGSIAEPFGMAPLEAIACGTPVVAHQSGGPQEIIDEGCGLLIDSLSVERWSAEVSDFLKTLKRQPGLFTTVPLRAAGFTWKDTLAPLLPVLGELSARVPHLSPESAQNEPNQPTASPVISIIMPCYQQAGYLEEAVRSVLDQREVEAELIVMDPGSTDGSRELLIRLRASYGERLKLHFAPDAGQSDAIGRGMELARGTVLAWLNSDDRLRPGALQQAARLLDSAEPRWLYGRCGIIDGTGRPISSPIVWYKNQRGRRFSIYKLLTENFLPQMATFWNRALWDQVGGVDRSRQLDMDYDLFLKFAKVTPPRVLRSYLADFRVHRDAKSSLRTFAVMDDAFLTAKQHAVGLGWRGKFSLLLHRLYGLRTRMVYRLIKP
jgi:glycosyltransferase involved in cell wall biosynthesis